MTNLACDTPILNMDAWIWNGHQQLPGTILLCDDRLLFQLQAFADTHLKLEIFLSDIEEVDSFIVFNVSRLGLLIRHRDGLSDRFILEDPEAFRKALLAQL